ncbi:MAG: hypothetical protein RIQ62_1106 [Bacteroidota bacterium]|jgi:hypothetical protein
MGIVFNRFTCFIAAYCLIFSNTLCAQLPAYPDAGQWNTFNISYKLNSHYSVLFTEECRFRENYSRLNLFYTNVGIEYKYNKHFKTSLVYRWIDKYLEEDVFSFRHRLMWDATAKYNGKNFTFAYRHRLQVEGRNFMSSDNGFLPEWYSRHKAELSYQINNHWSVYLSDEMRYQIHDPRNIESEHTWHRDRYAAGVDFAYTSSSKLGLYYLIQREYNVSVPENLFITGFEYSLSLGK